MAVLRFIGALSLALVAVRAMDPSFIAKVCRDQACNDAAYPIIDYDEKTNKCHCIAHPCWDDNGSAHSCTDPAIPFLAFSYTKEGKLECGCRKEAHITYSKFIAQVKCPGQHCASDDNFVDWDPEEKKCGCKPIPCHNIEGQRHSCGDAKFPVLHYREEKKPDGGIKQICECKAPMKRNEEL